MKVLIIAPKFYHYREQIALELEKMGNVVDVIDERPSNGTLYKILLRIGAKTLLTPILKKHYNKIEEKLEKKEYDEIFFINTEALNKKILLSLKSKTNNTRFTLYMWDSVKNKPDYIKYYQLFDKAFTFDLYDSQKYENLYFLPLFYSDSFSNDCTFFNYNKLEYDISFIGSGHSNRCEILSRLQKEFENKQLLFDCFIYFPSKILLYSKKIIGFRSMRNIFHCFFTKSLDSVEVSKRLLKSKAILDIVHTDQTGLTMRCIESIGLNKKLITTNQNVIKYEFYNEDMIFIIDKDKNQLPPISFFKKHSKFPDNVRKKYSLEYWLRQIFDFDHNTN